MHPVGISSTRTSDRPIPGNPHSTTCQQGFSSNIGEERTVNEDVVHEPERGDQASAIGCTGGASRHPTSLSGYLRYRTSICADCSGLCVNTEELRSCSAVSRHLDMVGGL